MRMLKLMAYGTIAYCAYQFFKGMGEVRRERSPDRTPDRSPDRPPGRPMDRYPGANGRRSPAERADASREQIAATPDQPESEAGVADGMRRGTGDGIMGRPVAGGGGAEVETTDPQGTSVRHRVGRGVVTP